MTYTEDPRAGLERALENKSLLGGRTGDFGRSRIIFPEGVTLTGNGKPYALVGDVAVYQEEIDRLLQDAGIENVVVVSAGDRRSLYIPENAIAVIEKAADACGINREAALRDVERLVMPPLSAREFAEKNRRLDARDMRQPSNRAERRRRAALERKR